MNCQNMVFNSSTSSSSSSSWLFIILLFFYLKTLLFYVQCEAISMTMMIMDRNQQIINNIANTNRSDKNGNKIKLNNQRHLRRKHNDHRHRHRRRLVSIEYKSWTGFKGMLPLQKYRNYMDKESFKNWLIKPMPSSDDEFFNMCQMTKQEQYQPFEKTDAIIFSPKSSNKEEAELKASLVLDPNEHLLPIYIDSHIVVVYKKSGVLSVPGPRRNPNVADLVYQYFGNEENDVDCMVVHRLDMDTSGVIIYARSKEILSTLHDVFRAKSQSQVNLVTKTYEALVAGHMSVMEGEIDLPLVRDRNNPPFMKVWNGENYNDDKDDNNDNNNNTLTSTIILENSNNSIHKHKGYEKMMSKPPKESLTKFRVISKEYLHTDIHNNCNDEENTLTSSVPVTRVELIPITGRTHQLRVHCAAIGHPIIGDNIYGIHGDGSPHGGFSYEDMITYFPNMASIPLQENIYQLVQNLRHQNIKSNSAHNQGYSGNLCLHAKQLILQHPVTKAPMCFEVDPPF